jgi:hypothetical protein
VAFCRGIRYDSVTAKAHDDLRERIADQRRKFDNHNVTLPGWTAPF